MTWLTKYEKGCVCVHKTLISAIQSPAFGGRTLAQPVIFHEQSSFWPDA